MRIVRPDALLNTADPKLNINHEPAYMKLFSAPLLCPTLLIHQREFDNAKSMINTTNPDALTKILNSTPFMPKELSTLFIWACFTQNVDIINTMIKNDSYSSTTLARILLKGIQRNGVEFGLARDLLNCSAFKAKALNTALLIAAKKGSDLLNGLSIIKTLVNNGAKLHSKNKAGQTPFELAYDCNRPDNEIINYLKSEMNK